MTLDELAENERDMTSRRPGVSTRPMYVGMNHGMSGQEDALRFLEPKLAPPTGEA